MRLNTRFAILFGFVVLSTLLGANFYMKAQVKSGTLSTENLEAALGNKSKYAYHFKDEKIKPRISARSYVVGDLDTGEIILEKESETKRPIASVSKIMTAIISNKFDEGVFKAKVSKTATATYGQNGNLKNGEEFSLKELLYPLLLESSNDAGAVLAEFFGQDFFIDKMNEEAKKLKLRDTSFEDPHGLSPNNVSTARDLFALTRFVKKEKPEILDLTKKSGYTTAKHNWSSNNQFLKEEGYLGGKSGYTAPALQTVISVFELPLGEGENRNIGITLLASADRYKDVTSLVKFLKTNTYYGEGERKSLALDLPKPKEELPEKTEPPITVLSIPVLPPPPPPPPPETTEPDFVTLSFLGDIMLDRGVESSVRKNFGNDYSVLFEKMSALKDGDVVFANLEGPASEMGKDQGGLYSFRMDPTVIPALRAGGIDIVSMANNHMGDYGVSAFSDTLSRLRENEILYTGGGESKEEVESPTVFERNGIKIGFLGFSDVGPDWMTAGENRPGILSAKNPRYEEIIRNASSVVDYLIVSFHWGDEYKTIHNPRQESLAHRAIDNGAKLVIGHHPHVIQDTEEYKNGFIAYSLGNFIFDQGFSQATMQGMWLEIKLHKNGDLEVKENIVKLSRLFKPESIELGKEREIKFSIE